MRVPSRTMALAAFLFFCSGALGLGYELVWIRKAALVIGATQIALSTVLTSFFLGLALGSRFFARYPRGRRSPLIVYGLLELAIGLYAVLFPVLFKLMEAFYGWIHPLFAGSSLGLFALRFLLLFVLFLIPTFFMGGTLPLLLDGLVANDRSIGSRTALLYGINILGAVIGVLFTGYYAAPHWGLNLTTVIAGLGNLLIGGAALLAFRRLSPIHTASDEGTTSRFFPAAAFVSGLLAIAYQVCWVRYFGLFHFGTVHLTAMLLAVYLLSLALGSFILAPLLHARWRPLRIVGVCQALVPIAAAFTLNAWRLAEYRFALQLEPNNTGGMRPSPTFELAHDSPEFWHFISETADALFFAPLFQTALVLVLPVGLIGTALPALIAAATRRSAGLRSISGRLIFWNTVGSSAGGFLSGYAMLPLVGLHRSLLLLGLGSLGLSLAAMLASRRLSPRGKVPVWSYAVPGAALLVLLGVFSTRKDITVSTIRSEHFPTVGSVTPDEAGRDGAQLEIKEIIEGPLTTAYVTEDEKTLRISSGFVQMGYVIKDKVNTQTLGGYVPLLLYPGRGTPTDCLGICLGSGQSFGALLRYPIERLDVVEISAEVTELALRHFADYNNGLGQDPRVRFHLDDGRHFVERAPDASYDLISMESPPPTTEGAQSLYSVEFYEQVRRVLRPDGVYMQFLPLYFLTPAELRSVIRTMAEVFPETFVVKVTFGDFVMLGYPQRPEFVIDEIRARSEILAQEWSGMTPPWGRWSPHSAHNIASFEGIASLLVTAPEFARQIEAPLVYHDDRQLLAYTSGDRWLARRYQGVPLIHLSFAELPLTDFSGFRQYFQPPLTDAQIDTLRSEQVAALWNLNVRHPREVGRKMQALRQTANPVERAGHALSIALDFDATLQKHDAFRGIEMALEALKDRPQLAEEQHRNAVRKIVRNRIAVYEEIVERWVFRFQRNYPGSPLVDVMRREVEEYRTRRAAADSLYLFR